MAKYWNSIKNNSSECCSDVGLNHTCHHCELGISKMNGLCLLTRLKDKGKFFFNIFLVKVLFGRPEAPVSSDRTPHSKNWHRSGMCHAPSTTTGTLCAGSRASEQNNSRYCSTAPPLGASAQRFVPNCLRRNWLLNSTERLVEVAVAAWSRQCRCRRVGCAQPLSW